MMKHTRIGTDFQYPSHIKKQNSCLFCRNYIDHQLLPRNRCICFCKNLTSSSPIQNAVIPPDIIILNEHAAGKNHAHRSNLIPGMVNDFIFFISLFYRIQTVQHLSGVLLRDAPENCCLLKYAHFLLLLNSQCISVRFLTKSNSKTNYEYPPDFISQSYFFRFFL